MFNCPNSGDPNIKIPYIFYLYFLNNNLLKIEDLKFEITRSQELK